MEYGIKLYKKGACLDKTGSDWLVGGIGQMLSKWVLSYIYIHRYIVNLTEI